MSKEEIKKLVAQMTLEEKASFCSGADFWHTEKLERLNIPETMVSDGPHGLRKQDVGGDHLGVNDSIKAVCFPTGCGTAASFNRDLLVEMGETLGNECQAEDVSVILGPAVNMKRSPLCGRNFEYYSEDPYLAGQIAKSHIKGVQSKNVGTSIKHFLANSQETRRMSSDVVIDERTLREIYLPAFEEAVKEAKPWTVMCSYNRINGVYASENKHFLTDVLRNEWGFDGYVVSDWGAVNDRVEGIKAGLDLEMPASFGENDRLIVEAVKAGTLDEALVDQSVERILNIVYRYQENRDANAVWDKEKDHAKAKKVADETIVLLKNEGILPLKEDAKIAFIGKFAKTPRFQGGGSSHINSFKVSSAWDVVSGAVPGYAKKDNVIYAQGYEDEKDEVNEELLQEAIAAAKESQIAVIFAGLPETFESEGFDRKHMGMPNCQNQLIMEIAKVQPNVVVVLHNGSPVEMPWLSDVKGVLETYLGGQAVGEATVDILFGKVNPSAKLAETFPLKLEDNPSYLYYIGEGDKTEYREGVFIGYRYYDKKKMDVLFPFGHGLSYTTFAYSNMQISCAGAVKKDGMLQVKDTDTVTVSVDVTNTGAVAGKEVVELYVSDLESTVIRPVRELKEFAKVTLEPGETKTVTFELSKRAFAYYNTVISDWHVESGVFAIELGQSSRNILCSHKVFVESTVVIPRTYDLTTTLGDLMKDPRAQKYLQPLMDKCMLTDVNETEGEGLGAAGEEMQNAMMEYLPVHAILSFADGTATHEQLQEIIDQINAEPLA